MALSFEVRQVGNVSVIRCVGRIIMGADSTALSRVMEDTLTRTRDVVLQMAGVDYIDSSGLGLLIRLLRRAETGGGRIALCALTRPVSLPLRLTNMASLFEIHEFEDEAIAALHLPAGAAGGSLGFAYANVLCATDAADVLSYASELLRQAGYGVLTAANATDAATLLALLAPPRLVVTTRAFREASDERFTRLLATAQVMDLAPEFSRANVGASAQALLGAAHNAIGPPAPTGIHTSHPPRLSTG